MVQETTVRAVVVEIIQRHFGCDETIVSMLEASLEFTLYELCDDSLDAVAILFKVEDYFDIVIIGEDEEMSYMDISVQDLVDLVEQLLPAEK